MSPNERRKLSVNSLLAYYAGQTGLFEERELAILSTLRRLHRATDRELMTALGFVEPNSVRPRITALIDDCVLYHADDKTCQWTGKCVRIVALRADPRTEQLVMALEGVA